MLEIKAKRATLQIKVLSELHTDMSLVALDRLGNRHRPNCTDAASAGAYQPVAALFRVRFS
jgi:hypothetical protein